MKRMEWRFPVFILLLGLLACSEQPEITVENDTLTISAQGYEESCITPYSVHFNVAGQWREGSFLPYQGPYYLDSHFIDKAWDNLGCDVVGICNPFHERTISLTKLGYEHIGWVEHDSGQKVQAFATLPPAEEIQVRLNYYADAACQRPVQYDTTISLSP